MGKIIYTVIWDLESLTQLYSLPLEESETRLIKNEVDHVLSINPYGKIKDIEVRVKDWRTNTKSLDEDWEGYWRIRVGDYRVIYKIEEDKVIIKISKVGDRETVYNHEDD